MRLSRVRLVSPLSLDANGPFAETWGYGNRPSDLPMLELLHHRRVV